MFESALFLNSPDNSWTRNLTTTYIWCHFQAGFTSLAFLSNAAFVTFPH